MFLRNFQGAMRLKLFYDIDTLICLFHPHFSHESTVEFSRGYTLCDDSVNRLNAEADSRSSPLLVS